MTPTTPPPWRGLALVGILVLTLNMRAVLSTISPIIDQIGADIPLTTTSLAVLGSLPPLAFAIVGLLAPMVTRRLGIDLTTLIAIVLIAVGNLGRGLATDYPTLLISSTIALAGIGTANVLFPPLVKKYFPSRIMVVTSAGMAGMAIGTAGPAIVAYPLAEAFGWQVSLGVWGFFALAAAVPWAVLALHGRRADRVAAALLPAAPRHPGRMLRSPLAWALLLAFAIAQLNIYAMFAWMPAVLVDLAHVSGVEAGALLGLYSSMGLFISLLLAAVAPRMRTPAPLIHVGVAAFVVGYGGLILAGGSAPWLWAILAGIGPTLMHVCLMLVGLRTRTHEGTVALSAFMQGGGYALAAAGPILFGLLFQVSGGWQVPLLTLMGTVLLASVAAVVLRGDRMLEDEWMR